MRLFGYYDVRLPDAGRAELLSGLLAFGQGISVDAEGRLLVPLFLAGRLRRALPSLPAFGGVRGLPSLLFLCRRHPGVFCGVLLALCFFFPTRDVVFDIRATDGDFAAQVRLLAEAEAAGLTAGMRFSSVDFSAAENRILAASDRFGWVQMHRCGNVLYLNFREKSTHGGAGEDVDCSDLVAAEDGILEELRVKSGIPQKRAGESVARGEVLISGVLSGALGEAYTRSDGVALARVERTVTVFVPRKYEIRRTTGERLEALTLSFGEKSIKIFENYGKSDGDCDIIEEKRQLTSFFGAKLPVFVTGRRRVYYETSAEVYDDARLVKVALARMGVAMRTALADAELNRATTRGEFTEDGYRLVCGCTVVCDIGKEKIIDVQKKEQP